MLTFMLVLLIPWFLALLITPLVIRWATAHDWLDHPTERKLHDHPVALLGGVAVFLPVALGTVGLYVFWPPLREALSGDALPWLPALGLLAMMVIGTIDDRWDVSAGKKAAAQTIVAALTWYGGFRIAEVELPLGFVIVNAAVPSFVLTVVWIVVVTNAFNLIDGIDGLTAGIGIIVMLTMYLLGTANREALPVVAALATAGALAGFLRFNLPPARIFLGDGGALAVGYAASVISIATYQKSSAAMVIVVPLLALGLPMLDVALAVMRRGLVHLQREGLRGLHPWQVAQAVVRADRGHIHYLLLRLGWPVQAVLIALYLLCAALAALALWVREWSSDLRWSIFAGLLLIGLVFLRALERRVERVEANAELELGRERAPGRKAAG